MQRQQALIAASSGAAGFIPYQGKLMDGMHFVKLDQAMAEIARVEDFYMDGIRSEAELEVKDAILMETPESANLRENPRDYLGVRAHRLDGRLLITLFNFQKTRGLTLRAALAERPDHAMRLTDAAGNSAPDWLRAPKDGGLLTPAQLGAGVECRIPPLDVIFLRLDI